MNELKAILPRDLSVIIGLTATEKRTSFTSDMLIHSLQNNKFTIYDTEVNRHAQNGLLDESLFLLRDDIDVSQMYPNIWKRPAIRDRLRVELSKVFNGTNVDKNSSIETTVELLLAGSTSELFTSCNAGLTRMCYHFDSNVFLQLNFNNGELTDAHFWRNSRHMDVDISFVKLRPVFAAISKIYKPTILTFDGPLRNYYSDKRTKENQ